MLVLGFWFSFLCCAATYVGYPMAVWFVGWVRPIWLRKEAIEPRVSVIISAYNEERHIRDKLVNTLALDYPKDKLEILVGSDGSVDATARIARELEGRGVRVLDFAENRGKTAVQNDCVAASSGEIMVFTDAASFLQAGALRTLLRNFDDPRVGCVAGRLRFVETGRNLTTQSQGLYWRYEVKIREFESRFGRVIGVDGPLYAMRREDYVPLGASIISDFISPLLVLAHGKKVVLEPEAVVDEDPTGRSTQEVRTRRRITLRGLVGLREHSGLLNPLRQPALAAQVFFHKVLRWFVGPLVAINFACAALLADRPFFGWMSLGYLCFFGLAAAGFVASHRGIRWRFLVVPYYFTLVNYAATLGIIDFLRRRDATSWRPVRG